MTGDSSLLLPIAALLAAGAGAGFAGGLFGIGGGFVVVPALVLILPMMGAQPDQITHIAIGTSLATIIFTSLRSVKSHALRNSVDFEVLKSWAPWVVGGTVLGAAIADFVSSGTLALIFGVGVLAFALHFLAPRIHDRQLLEAMPGGAAKVSLAGGLGLLSSLLGIGGGTITTMVMTLCGTPIHRAIGTASGMGAIIALPGTIGFIIIGFAEPGLPAGSFGYVNWPAAIGIVATSVLFAPLGVAAAHKLSPRVLRLVFGIYLIVVGVTMIANQ
ncbi:sulfite exporter TauE/SafE family protein [Alteraurantiacibacter aquimixticola]|uniref:Probable membrane transporter protein n=1 Tax=Alteraurantiacibacter aquimixticola TaxID=2489173 RepID=A0A4T3F5U4_9SPHN|nr:sulfite exporter TauE/SafE family protein [Alteraurantiacibacter aquimixticola]TIX51002.1 sulfite exporter TauE/SafE family protein [Alteraurantiacibacter aquimixticola]